MDEDLFPDFEKNLDSDEIENEIIVHYEDLIEFTFTENNFSIFYDKKTNVWYAQHYDEHSNPNIEIIEDIENDIELNGSIYLFDEFEFTEDDLVDLKENKDHYEL